jgi:serine/threonine-protein kinase
MPALSPERRQRADEVFEAALELAPEARPAFIQAACAGDPELTAAVERLLRAHERAGGVLDRPLPLLPAPAASTGARDGDIVGRLLGGGRIGSYRIVEELGRGGMGVVYLAERDDGHFHRRVAIKVLRYDSDADLLPRMVAERQILASLEHADITRLLDGGVTEDGRPYLVMEHVAGLPIDLYCDRMRLPLHARLRLFVRVARAVEFAHRNLVVHRDLKPSNILVTADGHVKLLDFGIAKLLNPALAGAAQPVTRSDARALTPEYASPEQLRGEPLTTATDVYSLGVVLYRLLTGCGPLRPGDGSVAGALRALLETEPARPSDRARVAEAPADRDQPGESIAERAAARGLSPERLAHALRGDLDAIALKALRKEPIHRYGSAEQLATDVERYLAGQAVVAHAGSRGYRARKLLLRHWVEAAAGVLVLGSMLLGAGTALWQARAAERARAAAERSRALAEGAARQSDAVTRFVVGLFESAGSDRVGEEVTARDLLQRGVERADALAGEPAVQSRLLDVIGRMYLNLGRFDRAETLLDRAVSVRRAALGERAPELAESLLALAQVEWRQARPDESRRLIEQALAIRRSAFGNDHPGVAEALTRLGYVSTLPAQETLYREALAIYQRTGAQPQQPVRLLQQLATNLRRQGRFEASIAADRQSLELARSRFGPESPEAAYAMIHLADFERDLRNDYAGAERLLRRGLELQTRHLGPNSLDLIHGLHSLADLRSLRGDHAEAEALSRRAYALRLAATGPDDPSLAGEMNELAGVLLAAGRLGEAERMARQAVALAQRTLGAHHPELAGLWERVAAVLAEQHRWAAADSVYDASARIRAINGLERSIGLAEAERARGRMHMRARRFPAAEAALRLSLSIMEERYPDASHPNRVDSRRALFELYTAWGRPTDAEKYRVPPGRFIPY